MGSFEWRQIWMGKQDCRGNGGGLLYYVAKPMLQRGRNDRLWWKV